MAHVIADPPTLTVEQALHGYADGHRLLFAPITLRPADARTMLILSDSSGAGARIPEAGYLTAYPLPDSRLYAVARTWAAPELPRPGCVWTHTLLIDFEDLAALEAPFGLLSLFRRPDAAALTGYDRGLNVEANDWPLSLDAAHADFAAKLLTALYEHPPRCVVADRHDGIDVDRLVLGLWGQQWPRLRRAMRLCTFSASDRSTDAQLFDIQLVTRVLRHALPRFRDVIDAESLPQPRPSWVEAAIGDLNQANGTLRAFLRRVGSDISDGREAFGTLCQLHRMIEDAATDPSALDCAIALVERSYGKEEGAIAHGQIARAALSSRPMRESWLDYVWQHKARVDPRLITEYAGDLGHELLRMRPTTFAALLVDGSQERAVAEAGVAAASVPECVEAIRLTPQISGFVIDHQPLVVTHPSLWSQRLPVEGAAFEAIAQNPSLRLPALSAMMRAGRADLAEQAVASFTARTVCDAVAGTLIGSADARESMPWLAAAARKPVALAEYLRQGKDRTWLMLDSLARVMGPADVPADADSDPWLLAVTACDESSPGEAGPALLTLLFARALAGGSLHPGALARRSFEGLYALVLRDRLPSSCWRLIEPLLPWTFSWLSWDKALRVRLAMAEVAVQRGIAPDQFMTAATDDRVFRDLVEVTARTHGGRRYLEHIRDWMREQGLTSGSRWVAVATMLADE